MLFALPLGSAVEWFYGLCAQSTIGDRSSENGSAKELARDGHAHQVGLVLVFCASLLWIVSLSSFFNLFKPCCDAKCNSCPV